MIQIERIRHTCEDGFAKRGQLEGVVHGNGDIYWQEIGVEENRRGLEDVCPHCKTTLLHSIPNILSIDGRKLRV